MVDEGCFQWLGGGRLRQFRQCLQQLLLRVVRIAQLVHERLVKSAFHNSSFAAKCCSTTGHGVYNFDASRRPASIWHSGITSWVDSRPTHRCINHEDVSPGGSSKASLTTRARTPRRRRSTSPP